MFKTVFASCLLEQFLFGFVLFGIFFVSSQANSSNQNHLDVLKSNFEKTVRLKSHVVIEKAVDPPRNKYNERLGNREKRQISKYAKRWESDTVSYYFAETISEAKKAVFYEAFGHINSTTCIKFVENKKAKNRMKIVNSDGCVSNIGEIGGEQKLEFGDDCVDFGTAVHELMHALGVLHTQERYDRDDFLKVDFSVINKTWWDQVKKQTKASTYNAVPFEYGSDMIYSRSVLGNGSMEPKNPDYARTMGNSRVSFYDMQMVNIMYDCKCKKKLDCKNGGYANPSNCKTCNCPTGYGGALCDTKPTNTTVLNATSTWESFEHEFGFLLEGFNSWKPRTNFLKSYIWITAPVNTTIEVQLLSINEFYCDDGCDYNGIEIKTDPDPKIVNPIICCDDDKLWNRVYRSKSSPLVMAMFQRLLKSSFRFRYRYVKGTAKEQN